MYLFLAYNQHSGSHRPKYKHQVPVSFVSSIFFQTRIEFEICIILLNIFVVVENLLSRLEWDGLRAENYANIIDILK